MSRCAVSVGVVWYWCGMSDGSIYMGVLAGVLVAGW